MNAPLYQLVIVGGVGMLAGIWIGVMLQRREIEVKTIREMTEQKLIDRLARQVQGQLELRLARAKQAVKQQEAEACKKESRAQ